MENGIIYSRGVLDNKGPVMACLYGLAAVKALGLPLMHPRDENKLNVARRTCGYIGTQFWNQGRTQEIKERVLHL